MKKRVRINLNNAKRKNENYFKRLNNFFYNNFKLSLEYFKKTKNYIFFSLILFFVSIFLGYLFPGVFEKEVLEVIEELIRQTEGLGPLELTGFIMANNIQSAFFGMILGVFFAIVPFFVISVNGYVLGFVINKSIALEGFGVLFKLVPHGMFEIPAVLISIGLGLKLGMFLFVYKGKNKRKEFFKWVLDSLRVFVLIAIPLLVIAAVIEGLLIWLIG